ncbi:hypothetical protein NDU88_003314 [Pleurodeles waltl]|uniref:Uncharacterized protein n=1 Tax=Pleurodeles waltl TaxID=8319 RepID=A0AAV7PBW7_PLEWA|nr:hypothetical protein NDU88_003314 [Pleurodeles waltl]
MAPPFVACVSRPLRSPGGPYGEGGSPPALTKSFKQGALHTQGAYCSWGLGPLCGPIARGIQREPSGPSNAGPRKPPKRGPPRGPGRHQSHSAARARPGADRSSLLRSGVTRLSAPSGRHRPSAASGTSGKPQGDPLPGQSSAFQARVAELGPPSWPHPQGLSLMHIGEQIKRGGGVWAVFAHTALV